MTYIHCLEKPLHKNLQAQYLQSNTLDPLGKIVMWNIWNFKKKIMLSFREAEQIL